MSIKLDKPTLVDLIRERRMRNIQRYGSHAMAYSSTQDGIMEYRNPAFKGFIAYTQVCGIDVVLGDPITPIKDQFRATTMFLSRGKAVVFMQISEAYAKMLSLLKLKINSLGIEHIVELNNFKVTWRKRKCLKSYLSKLSKQDYYVFEYPADPVRVEGISEQWLKSKQNGKELRFLARPFVGTDERHVRYFYLIKERKVYGFVTFDPVFADDQSGRVVSYVLQHLRVDRGVPLGAQDYLILNALNQFKEEGIKEISLGLSPLYRRINDMFNYSRIMEWIFKIFYKLSFLYNFKTIGQHKDHYKARTKQTYIAFSNQFTVNKLCALLKANNLA